MIIPDHWVIMATFYKTESAFTESVSNSVSEFL